MKKIKQKLIPLDIQNLLAGKYKSGMPEFYELIRVNQKNQWHNETVYDHTVMAYFEAFKILMGSNQTIREYFDQTLDDYSFRDILLLTIILHDIGKKETQIKNPDDTYSFPNHCQKGSILASKILKRFNVPKSIINRITKLIKYHHILHNIDYKNKDFDIEISKVKTDYADIYLDLLVLTKADVQSCMLYKQDSDLFVSLVLQYQRLLDEFEQTDQDLKHQAQRAIADYHNLEKRAAKEKDDWIKFGNFNLFSRLLDVTENLDRAANFINDPGLDMVRSDLDKLFKEFGVEEIKTKDQMFDPATMEAVDKKTGPKNKVLQTSQKGYILHGRILRPAKVVVGA